MHCWQVTENINRHNNNKNTATAHHQNFQNPNEHPLLGTGAIWPRHSVEFSKFFAKHYKNDSSSSSSTATTKSWNSEIGKGIAAKQIANALSMIPSSMMNDSSSEEEEDDEYYFDMKNEEEEGNDGSDDSDNNEDGEEPSTTRYDFDEEIFDDDEHLQNDDQDTNDIDVMNQIQQTTKATTVDELHEQVLMERRQHSSNQNQNNDDDETTTTVSSTHNNTNQQQQQNPDNHFDTHHHNTLNPPLKKSVAIHVSQRNPCLLRDFGGDGVLDLPHVALILPTSEIAVIDRDLARVHIFAPNSPHQHRTLLTRDQLVGPLGGCVTAVDGDLVVCDLVGASVVVVDPLAGITKVRWLGKRSGSVSETDMRNKTKVYRADFLMPKDAVEVPLSVLGPEIPNSSSSPTTTSSAISNFFGFGNNSSTNNNNVTSPTNNNNNNKNTSWNPNKNELEPCATIISDYGSGTLVRLNHKTGYSQVIEISPQHDGSASIKPGALCYDAKTKSLLVSDELKNRIYIFRPHDFQKIGVVDLHSLLHAGMRSGPYGMTSVFTSSCSSYYDPHNNNNDNENINTPAAPAIGILASNPTHKSVLMFHDILGKSQTEPPKWGVSRNGPKIFKFPSGVTLFPYNTFCVVCRNTGYCHFVAVPKNKSLGNTKNKVASGKKK